MPAEEKAHNGIFMHILAQVIDPKSMFAWAWEGGLKKEQPYSEQE